MESAEASREQSRKSSRDRDGQRIGLEYRVETGQNENGAKVQTRLASTRFLLSINSLHPFQSYLLLSTANDSNVNDSDTNLRLSN